VKLEIVELDKRTVGGKFNVETNTSQVLVVHISTYAIFEEKKLFLSVEFLTEKQTSP